MGNVLERSNERLKCDIIGTLEPRISSVEASCEKLGQRTAALSARLSAVETRASSSCGSTTAAELKTFTPSFI